MPGRYKRHGMHTPRRRLDGDCMDGAVHAAADQLRSACLTDLRLDGHVCAVHAGADMHRSAYLDLTYSGAAC